MNVFIYLSDLASFLGWDFNQKSVQSKLGFFVCCFVDCVEIRSLVEQKRDAVELFDDATKKDGDEDDDVFLD